LCYLALKTYFSKPAESAAITKKQGLFGAYISTFFLTLTNPATILSFAAVFAGLGLGQTQGDYLQASWLVLGVFLGSAIWWLMLSEGVGFFRDKFDREKLIWVNRLSGLIIGFFGVLALASLIRL
jgi:threonine/homoserine/homoserine lactone efflux protein